MLVENMEEDRKALRECLVTEAEAVALSAALQLARGNVLSAVKRLRTSWQQYDRLRKNRSREESEEVSRW